MQVFKFHAGRYFYVMAAQTEEEAKECLLDYAGEMEVESVELVPEAEWDELTIVMHEDNDTDTEPFYTSIREQMVGDDAQFICSNDWALFD